MKLGRLHNRRRISKAVSGSVQRAWAYDGAHLVAEINGATFLIARPNDRASRCRLDMAPRA
jgi:hypothetical protein